MKEVGGAKGQVPSHLRLLFWDTDITTWDPAAYPVYVIERVLERGDTAAVEWMREAFTAEQVVATLRSARNLTPRSANYWALRYGVRRADVAAFRDARATAL
ncbi:MAG: hypothetical protein ABL971_10300 [Vicinamibacterales bacterium]